VSSSHRTRTAVAAFAVVAVAAPASALAAPKPKLPTIFSFTPTAAAAMKTVVVKGANFAHIKTVTVDGMKATFKLDSASTLTVTIPAKAKSGKIVVTTSAGTAKSTHALKIKA
jgi:IPT/TIG domain